MDSGEILSDFLLYSKTVFFETGVCFFLCFLISLIMCPTTPN